MKEAFRERLPFLREIPDAIYSRLDTSEFVMPDEEIDQIRQSLEFQLQAYVMTYNSQVFNTDVPPEAHLCGNLKGADLSEEQLRTLQEYEGIVRPKGVSFVVYQKPIQLIDPQESPVAILHKNKVVAP